MSRREKRKYEDDDGRIVADMSGLSSPSMGGWLPPRRPGREKAQAQLQEDEHPLEDQPLTWRERLWCTLGALGASLLIGLAFLVGLGLVILLLLLLWS